LNLYSSHGFENIMRLKFAPFESALRGYMRSLPMQYFCATATSVDSFAIMRIADTSRVGLTLEFGALLH